MYQHLSFEERVKIETYRGLGYGVSRIAHIMGRNKGTISRELRRNKVKGKYTGSKAQVKSYQRNHWKKRQSKKIVINNEMEDYIRKKLLDSWSPELIAEMLKQDGKKLCGMSIRRYLESRYCYGIKQELIEMRFKKYYKRRSQLKQQGRLGERPFIDQKQGVIDGEYEMDFIISTEGDTSCLLNFVHKKSCLRISIKLPNRSTELVDKTIKEIVEKRKIKCIVTDNDISFVHRKDRGVPVYFTHPYHSREKGLIERVNKGYRMFYPKKTQLKNISQIDIDRVTHLLNSKPMKRLNYKTPNEIFQNYITNI